MKMFSILDTIIEFRTRFKMKEDRILNELYGMALTMY
jgi:hypothetical protein